MDDRLTPVSLIGGIGMIRVFVAQNLIEAHIVRGLLESRGISAQVNGGYLQGAVGELPAQDLQGVVVPDEDVGEARSVIEEYERSSL